MRSLFLLFLAGLATTGIHAQQAPVEDDYYRIVTVPIPEGIVLEVGGLTALPDGKLAVATRRGDIWIVENAAMSGGALPHYKQFAHGLHEPLGLAYVDGAFVTAQRGELTRLKDTTGDGRANDYEAVYAWPLEGNYHEYSYGPLMRKDGTMIVMLNLAWTGFGASLSEWRGWTLAIDADGAMTPIATGMRSPAGMGFNTEGDLFYAENQGDWIGSGYITHVTEGDFVGNPAGLRWSSMPGSPVTLTLDDIPDTGEPLFEVAKRVPGLKPPAVWFPHTILGISTSDIVPDTTGGAFGPFTGQLLVGDQGHSKIARVFLEKVNGVYQGAAFPFREGFASGVLRMAFDHEGGLFVGMTNRGWSSTGKAPFGLQRLVWTGRVPFEVLEMKATPDGFELVFTQPVDPASAGDPTSYAAEGFTYMYHSTYGSPPIHRQEHAILGVVVSEDNLRARLVLDGMREGYIHQLSMAGVRSEDGYPLLHDAAYYTLNRIPDGDSLAIAMKPGARRQPAETALAAQGPKHQTTRPDSWDVVDATIVIGTLPGLRFDAELLEITAGSRVAMVFNNNDDMLHNLIITHGDAVDTVATEAMRLGLAGHEMAYVPESDNVLYHTGLLAPDSAETIYFSAPSAPGDYAFVCTFPGHATTMRGILRVTAR